MLLYNHTISSETGMSGINIILVDPGQLVMQSDIACSAGVLWRVLNLVFDRHFGFAKCRGLGGVKRVGRGRERERKNACLQGL